MGTCKVLPKMDPMLRLLGKNFIDLLSQSHRIHIVSPAYSERLDILRSRLIASNSEDSNQFFEDENMGADPDFDPTTDSRHSFRSAEAAQVYNNRERCKDSFWRHLMKFKSKGFEVMQFENEAKTLVSSLHPANIGWFAMFFQTQLLKLCSQDVDAIFTLQQSG